VSERVVSIHPAALHEAEFATEWYRQRSVRAAERFLDEVDRLLRRIEEHPDSFQAMSSELGAPFHIVSPISSFSANVIWRSKSLRLPMGGADRVLAGSGSIGCEGRRYPRTNRATRYNKNPR
jgi:hypothetical protein